jgi:hypothetical protein
MLYHLVLVPPRPLTAACWLTILLVLVAAVRPSHGFLLTVALKTVPRQQQQHHQFVHGPNTILSTLLQQQRRNQFHVSSLLLQLQLRATTRTDATDVDVDATLATAGVVTVTVSSAILGDISRIRMEGDITTAMDESSVSSSSTPSSFLGAMGVATFKCSGGDGDDVQSNSNSDNNNDVQTVYRPVEGDWKEHGPVFCVDAVLSQAECRDIIQACESLSNTDNDNDVGNSGGNNSSAFGSFRAGKNNHGALQLVVATETADMLARRLARHIDMDAVEARRLEMIMTMQQQQQQQQDENAPPPQQPQQQPQQQVLVYAGVNRRWRVYKYAPNSGERFAPHIDAGFPPSGLSAITTADDDDDDEREVMVFDASSSYQYQDDDDDDDDSCSTIISIVSRLTVLLYLNDDFVGGETNFYEPILASVASDNPGEWKDWTECRMASVRPVTGSCLIFPQCVGEETMEYARHHWPLHEGSPVHSGSPKYVIRSDILFAELKSPPRDDTGNSALYPYDHLVQRR